MMHRKTFLLALSALLWCAFATFAQSISGNLTGTIYDPSGATVPNAKVAVRNEATGVETSSSSTSTGEYNLPNLPAGSYTITVTGSGFAQSQIKGVTVTLNQTVTSNIRLEVGQATQTVEVTAGSAQQVNLEFRADNIVRGTKGEEPGLMSLGLRTLLNWAEEMLAPREIFLRVFDDNQHAIGFYERLGFVRNHLLPLRRHQDAGATFYRPVAAEDTVPADRHFLPTVRHHPVAGVG